MARKSISGAADTSVASVGSTPAGKGRKSISETPATPSSSKKPSEPVDIAPASGLVIPPAAQAVFAQQAGALKALAVGLDQLELPKTSVVKLAKSEIPDNVQLRKEVTAALLKASTVFISYLTAASHDTAISNGLKTISGQNVLDAVRDLDLGIDVRLELKKELDAFRALTKEKRQSKAGGKKAVADEDESLVVPLENGDDDDDDADASRFTTATGADQDEADADVDVGQDQEEEVASDGDDDEEGADGGDESVLSVRSRANGSTSLATHAGEQLMETD